MCFVKDEQGASPGRLDVAVPGRPSRSLVAEDRAPEASETGRDRNRRQGGRHELLVTVLVIATARSTWFPM
jgi:hypothetical protein